ncbi:MAG: hypothetical protein D6718_01995 [Acidobacteria bacterium]|nr:MAG: hypothetical protein D6718_01995 [Acidobacteriota bacterium]
MPPARRSPAAASPPASRSAGRRRESAEVQAVRAHRFLFALLALVLSATPAAAQFGQNKITYETFDWKVYRSPHFDVHFYELTDAQLEEVVSEAESAYLDLSQRLDHEVRIRIPMILYRTHKEFQQTNISLQEIPEAVAAFTEPFQMRMVLPIDDPPDKRYKLIRHELVHVFEFDIFFGDSLRRTIRGRAPLWLMEGLASYLGDDEDSFDQMVIRDAVVNNLVPSIRELDVLSFLTYRYGHAIFDFIEKEFGPQGVRSFLFEFRKSLLSGNIEKPLRDAFDMSVEQFDRRFARYLRRRYLPVLTDKLSPDEYGKEVGLSKPGRFTFSPELSPSGDLIAALATPGLELDVVILSAKDGELIRNLTRGFTNKYDSIVTGVFEGKRDLAWSPDGSMLAFFVARENVHELRIYDPVSGRLLERITIDEIAAPRSPAFSPDGQWIAFSGNLGGYWDIFRVNIDSKEIENLTRDVHPDSNPSWTPDGKRILYNRRIGSFEKIFSVEVGAPEHKTQLTTGAASDIQPRLSQDGQWIYFSSDRGLYGVFNLHRLSTADGRIERLTDLAGGAFAPVELAPAGDGARQLVFSAFSGGTFRLYRMKLAGEAVEKAIAAGKAEPRTSPLAPSRRRSATEEREGGSAVSEPPQTGKEDEDLRPFVPPLRLRLDADKQEDYRLTWRLDQPDITLGVTDDGRLLSHVALQFSDLLGNQRIFIASNSVNQFSNTSVTYLNVTRRLDWGAQLADYRDFFLVSDSLGRSSLERSTRITQVSGFLRYPFNRHYRVEAQLGYAQQRYDLPLGFDVQTGELLFLRFSNDFPFGSLSLVGDTTRFRNFGPFHGHRFRLDLTGYKVVSGDLDGESVKEIRWDYRGYQHLTARSLVGVRFAGVLRDGRLANVSSLGGLNQLRGFRFREFFGENVVWANLELRFPLFDRIVWSFGLPTGPVRAAMFVDAGSAWYGDELLPDGSRGKIVYDPLLGAFRPYATRGPDGKLLDLHVSAGFDLSVPLLGLPMHWSFARIYDGDTLGPTRSDFYITFDW